MIDGRLFKLVNKRPLILLVLSRLLNLSLSLVIWYNIALVLSGYLQSQASFIVNNLGIIGLSLVAKSVLAWIIARLTYACSDQLRLNLRQAILQKAFSLEAKNLLPSATLAQYGGEGINQLDLYYARFLPQLFYCLGSTLLIFGILFNYAWRPALVLLICLPLIPLTIIGVMKTAKKILGKYWQSYTDLGQDFAESLRGLSTLKDFGQDQAKQVELQENAGRFKKATMSLLAMQLNSITVMDLISYCGAGLSIGLALWQYQIQQINLLGCLLFILLSAEFFLPLRQLGSFFHVALNGISAMKELFTFLDLAEPQYGKHELTQSLNELQATVKFKYAKEHFTLEVADFTFKKGQFIAFVGQSGSGKSTFGKLLSAQLTDYQGKICWNGIELKTLTKATLHNHALYLNDQGYLFKDTLKNNLLVAKDTATDAELKAALAAVKLDELALDQQLSENGRELSGGQRQRLLLARALLSPAQLIVLDEITAGVDQTSEQIIMQTLHQLAKEKLLIFISHRLYNILEADQIYVFEEGRIVASGTAEKLRQTSPYFKAYFAQEQEILRGQRDAKMVD